MPRKLGQGADELFRRTEREAPGALRGGAERAREPASAKVTFLLTPSQTTFLDELCLVIKRETGYGMRRTEVVRALIEVLRHLDLEPAGLDSEERLRDRILERLA